MEESDLSPLLLPEISYLRKWVNPRRGPASVTAVRHGGPPPGPARLFETPIRGPLLEDLNFIV
jgi:hypothetical protein